MMFFYSSFWVSTKGVRYVLSFLFCPFFILLFGLEQKGFILVLVLVLVLLRASQVQEEKLMSDVL